MLFDFLLVLYFCFFAFSSFLMVNWKFFPEQIDEKTKANGKILFKKKSNRWKRRMRWQWWRWCRPRKKTSRTPSLNEIIWEILNGLVDMVASLRFVHFFFVIIIVFLSFPIDCLHNNNNNSRSSTRKHISDRLMCAFFFLSLNILCFIDGCRKQAD